MLINSLDLDATKMPRVFEKPTSPKVGHFVPSTRIEIVSDEYLAEAPEENLIIWAWHIADEILPYLETVGFKGTVWQPLPTFQKIAELR